MNEEVSHPTTRRIIKLGNGRYAVEKVSYCDKIKEYKTVKEDFLINPEAGISGYYSHDLNGRPSPMFYTMHPHMNEFDSYDDAFKLMLRSAKEDEDWIERERVQNTIEVITPDFESSKEMEEFLKRKSK